MFPHRLGSQKVPLKECLPELHYMQQDTLSVGMPDTEEIIGMRTNY